MTNIKDKYPGFVTLEDSFALDTETITKYQLGHLNQYRSQIGLDGGLTFNIKKAEGCYLWDSDGNKRLDFIGCVGVYILGHNNPYIIDGVRKYLDQKPMTMDPLALKAQSAAFAHNMSLVTPELTRTVVCGGGGAEANEAVIKMCKIAAGRTKKGKKRIVSTLNSFHGKTNEAVFTGGKDIWQRWLTPPPDHSYVPYGDWHAVEEEFKKDDVIMFIAEPIQGEGGIVVPPDDYLPKIRELCDKYDVYMVLDEVQAGSCRTGYIWAHKYYEGLVPDAFTFAKAISDGVLPVSGVQAKDDLYLAAYGSFESAMNHTATYQDNNMSGAVALLSLTYMLEHDVPGMVREKAKYIWDGLADLQAKYPHILEEVRGRGFMIGLKFNKDESGVGYANAIGKELAVNHLIHTMTSINNDTILRAYPNIWTTKEDFDWFLGALEESFLAVEGK
ncbi:MAG: aminotransferase class III-fold pyridoxal phosphate-dependent enzyme [Clostridiales Family XIII bacterium]|jgi:putrescine aminotransferase|nr:aminotransferase class III-fold pyridoxal phosphate-dependent enzyme [Clostridiales Family XIII bacterium]